MKVHAFSTGTVAIKQRQIRGAGPGPLRPLTTMTSHDPGSAARLEQRAVTG